MEQRNCARLPDAARTERRIGEMQVGDSGWTVPWALTVLHDRSLYLNGGHALRERSGGTVQLRVMRTEAGFECDMYPYFGEPYGFLISPERAAAAGCIPVSRLGFKESGDASKLLIGSPTLTCPFCSGEAQREKSVEYGFYEGAIDLIVYRCGMCTQQFATQEPPLHPGWSQSEF